MSRNPSSASDCWYEFASYGHALELLSLIFKMNTIKYHSPTAALRQCLTWRRHYLTIHCSSILGQMLSCGFLSFPFCKFGLLFFVALSMSPINTELLSVFLKVSKSIVNRGIKSCLFFLLYLLYWKLLHLHHTLWGQNWLCLWAIWRHREDTKDSFRIFSLNSEIIHSFAVCLLCTEEV